jgi:hypothetical protein
MFFPCIDNGCLHTYRPNLHAFGENCHSYQFITTFFVYIKTFPLLHYINLTGTLYIGFSANTIPLKLATGMHFTK